MQRILRFLLHLSFWTGVFSTRDRTETHLAQPKTPNTSTGRRLVFMTRLPVEIVDRVDNPVELRRVTSAFGQRQHYLMQYVVNDELRTAKSNYEDPFGGCRLRCPVGFIPEDYHIHMHKVNRKTRKGGKHPARGVYHHDWRQRAE